MGGISDQMAGIRECGACPGRDQVELLEVVFVFDGRNHGVFYSAVDDCRRGWRAVLSTGLCHDRIYYCTEAGFWRSCVRLAVLGVYYAFPKRRTIFLHGDTGTVPGENLYGGQETSHLSDQGGTINLNSFLTAKIFTHADKCDSI